MNFDQWNFAVGAVFIKLAMEGMHVLNPLSSGHSELLKLGKWGLFFRKLCAILHIIITLNTVSFLSLSAKLSKPPSSS